MADDISRRDGNKVAGLLVYDDTDGFSLRRVRADANGHLIVVGSASSTPLSVTPTTIVVDANNSTTTPLAAGATFTGSATNLFAYNQINLTLFATPAAAMASLFFEFSPNSTNWDISVPILVRDPTLFIPYPLIGVNKFFRLRYLNDGGVAAIAALGLDDTAGTPTLQTVFRLTCDLLPFATKDLARTLDQGVSGSDPVVLSRSAIMGRNANNSVVNKRIGGTNAANSSTANIASGASFTGAWVDMQDYASITVLINSTLNSATNGVDFQFSSDAGVTIHDHVQFSYVTSAGGEVFVTDVESRYFRLVYTNTSGSGTATNVNIETRFHETELSPTGIPFNQRVNRLTSSGTPVRADIVPLPTWQTAQQNIGVTSVQLTCSSSPMAQRKTLTIKSCLTNANNTIITISSSSPAILAGNGHQLGIGDSITLELSDQDDLAANVPMYGISNDAAARISMTEIA